MDEITITSSDLDELIEMVSMFNIYGLYLWLLLIVNIYVTSEN